jgi:hypothetical protein
MTNSGSEVRYEDMTDLLVARVPELRKEIDEIRDWWAPEVPGQHVVYGDVLTPYLERLLQTGEHEERLRYLFTFLEELAENPDVHVQEVVVVTILEYLLGHSHLLAKARELMAPNTLAMSYELEHGWQDFYDKNPHAKR